MTRVVPLLVLAVLALAVVLYAGQPQKAPSNCVVVNQISVTGVASGGSITISGIMEVWGIPKMGSYFYRPTGSELTVAAPPEPTDGHYSVDITINYVVKYTYTLTTYTLNCTQGNKTYTMTWRVFQYGAETRDVYTYTLNAAPLAFSVALPQVNLPAAPLCQQVAAADEYQGCDAAPMNYIYYSVTLLNDQTQLSGFEVGQENKGSLNVGTRVRTIQLVFKNGDPPAAVTTASYSCAGKCGVSFSGPGGAVAALMGDSQGPFSASLRLTAALPTWYIHTFRADYQNGWSARLIPVAFVYDPSSGSYIGPWSQVAAQGACPQWSQMGLVSFGCRGCGFVQALSVGLASLGDRYGAWIGVYPTACTNLYRVDVWRYSNDLPAEHYLSISGASAKAPGRIRAWIPDGGVAPLYAGASGTFTDLDGNMRSITYTAYSWYPENGVVELDTSVSCTSVGCNTLAWNYGELVIAGAPNNNVLFFWGFPAYTGGTPVPWVARYSRSPNIPHAGRYDYWPIIYHTIIGVSGVADILPTGFTGNAMLSHDFYFDFATLWQALRGGSAVMYQPAGDLPYSATVPGAVSTVADVPVAYGATPFAVSVGGGRGKGNPPPAIGNCTLTSIIAVSAAPGAWTTSPRAYATAPAWFAWPGMPFVLAVKVPYSLNCPDQLTAKVYVYANYTCRGHCHRGSWLYLGQFTLRKGQAVFIGPNASAPYKPVVCGRFTDTGLSDWLNAPKRPGVYPIRIEWEGYINGQKVSKTEHLAYEVRPVEVEWETETPMHRAINEPTAVLRMWLRFVGTDKYAPWWPYGVGRGGLAAPDGCTAVYEAEEVPSNAAWSTHFGDLAAAYVNYVTAQPEVKYSPKDRKVYISAPYAQGWYVYINRGGAWKLVGIIPSQTIAVSTNVTVPVWPWDPVMLVPITSTSGVGGTVTYPRPGYVLFFNFWSLPLTNPPAQSDPARFVTMVGGRIV